MKRISYSPQTLIRVPNIFGDGSDGDHVVTGTEFVTSEVHYRNLTIMPGGILYFQGQRMFVSGVLLNYGTISTIDGDALNGSSGYTGDADGWWQSMQGADGRGAAGVGAAAPVPAGNITNFGKFGGHGGAAGGNAGGSGSGANPPGYFDSSYLANIPTCFNTSVNAVGVEYALYAGGGGGAGGFATGATGTSGGGGGGGSSMFISTKYLNNSAGLITAPGGRGGNASGTGNSGGGGGGSGGSIMLLCLQGTKGVVTAPGGAGGTGLGTGANGTAGVSGTIIYLEGI